MSVTATLPLTAHGQYQILIYGIEFFQHMLIDTQRSPMYARPYVVEFERITLRVSSIYRTSST